jgi:voltage-gated sodium channel
VNREELEFQESRLLKLKQIQDESSQFWEKKVQALQAQVDRQVGRVEADEEEYGRFLSPVVETPPPGPRCLLFVEGKTFMLLATSILITNIVTMVMEMLHPHYKVEFFWLDQFFIAFYLLELVAKAILFQRDLLIGHFQDVWWNWLDLVVVVVGVVDQWLRPMVMPLISGSHSQSHSTSVLQFVRMLRMARLARVLKVVRLFFRSDFSWAEGSRFQLFIMSVIYFNSLLMSFEAEYPDFFLWFYVEQILLMIFTFEISLRLKLWGCDFFTRKEDIAWNLLDFLIVVGGVVDQWMMPAIDVVQSLLGMPSSPSGQVGQFMVLLRMARLLRILRLVRLVRSVPPLFTLIVGIVQAMQGLMWVLVLTAVVLYVFSLLAVKLIGHGLLFGGPEFVPDDVRGIFPSVCQSMFVLFMAMNGDPEWLEPAFQILPASRIMFVAYVVLSSWAILSILTAVISENMISATEKNRQEQEKEDNAVQWEKNVIRLTGVIAVADPNKNGYIERDEFYELIKDRNKAQELCDAVGGLTVPELKDLFECLSCTGTGYGGAVRQEDFVEGLQNDSQPVRRREILHVERRLAVLERSLMRIEAAVVKPQNAEAYTKGAIDDEDRSNGNGKRRDSLKPDHYTWPARSSPYAAREDEFVRRL